MRMIAHGVYQAAFPPHDSPRVEPPDEDDDEGDDDIDNDDDYATNATARTPQTALPTSASNADAPTTALNERANERIAPASSSSADAVSHVRAADKHGLRAVLFKEVRNDAPKVAIDLHA